MRRRDAMRLFLAAPLLGPFLRGTPPAQARQPSTSLEGQRLFPLDNPWNQDVSQAPLDPNSETLIASIGLDRGLHPDFGTVWQGAPIGIPYVVVDGDQPRVPVTFEYADESDPGPYPIPADVPIEGGGDSSGERHVLIVDRDNFPTQHPSAEQPPCRRPCR